jgi:hypothetical protein
MSVDAINNVADGTVPPAPLRRTGSFPSATLISTLRIVKEQQNKLQTSMPKLTAKTLRFAPHKQVK